MAAGKIYLSHLQINSNFTAEIATFCNIIILENKVRKFLLEHGLERIALRYCIVYILIREQFFLNILLFMFDGKY